MDHVVAAGKPLRVNAVSESTVATLVAAYYARVPSADLAHRTPDELYWLAANHVRLAATRPLGGDAVEVTTPPAQDGPPSLRGGNTLITIVTDDVAMLFDSLIMELTAQQRGVHVALHPQISVLRDSVTGVMESVATQREASDDR
ncbi:hypothetical protein A5642_10225 [Mycolicibacterium mucogenicum]|uniref:NAD-glutamate dehydrogenase N-terminal ACT1 domain-containing protein n=2 Tax=Mycolicibacterium TaxID=1866885 RepID=A0A1A0N2C1_MYCMU|nr:hypothetical protein A5642_10225 [Mycolicibacterium mucogenicum]